MLVLRMALAVALAGFAACGPANRPLVADAGTRPSGGFSAPLKSFEVLSRFGKRGRRFHTGIDIRGRRGGGDPVFAAKDGKVTRAQVMSGYGRLVEIKHPDGFSTRYAHLKRIGVAKGQKVRAGDPIGIVGRTGRATTEHLHFEILTPAYRFVDPEPFISGRAKQAR